VLTADVNQRVLKGAARVSAALLGRVLRETGRALGLKETRRLSIAFVGEEEMRRLNRTWRGKDRVTDVLAFPLAGGGTEEELVGEVLVCYPQAKRQAEELGHSPREEVLMLVVHGILHVFGYDHERTADARRMFPLQNRILKRLGIDLPL